MTPDLPQHIIFQTGEWMEELGDDYCPCIWKTRKQSWGSSSPLYFPEGEDQLVWLSSLVHDNFSESMSDSRHLLHIIPQEAPVLCIINLYRSCLMQKHKRLSILFPIWSPNIFKHFNIKIII